MAIKDPKTVTFSKIQSEKLPPGAIQLDDTGENFQEVGGVPPSIQGEESISGSDPIPGVADADLLANAHAVGEQLGETEQKHEDVSIARDVDKSEEADQRG